MNFQDLKDNFVSQFKVVLDRVEESTAYQQLKDRYENLTPNMQKAVNLGAVAVVVVIFLTAPWGSLLQSVSNLDEYLAKRALIRDLLKTAKEVNELPEMPQAPMAEEFKARVESELQSARVVKELIKSIEVVPVSSNLVPADLIDSELEIQISKLNLKQIVDVGHQIQAINSAAKMSDVSLSANAEDARYYDVIYRVLLLKTMSSSNEDFEEAKPNRGTNR
jgi:hypothetical protein